MGDPQEKPRSKWGRRLPEGAARDEIVGVRFTREERQALCQRSVASRCCSLSAYLRRLALADIEAGGHR